MKKRFLFFLSALMLPLLLTGCFCEHEWIAADCVNPQICAKCEKIGDPALGHEWTGATCTAPETCVRCSATQGFPLEHIWSDATCTTPQTCSRCSDTQGGPLPHEYGVWTFSGEQMDHCCNVCNYVETLPIDHSLYLETMLTGHWNFYSVHLNDESFSAEQFLLKDPSSNSYISFGPNNSCQIAMGLLDIEAFDSTWTYQQQLELGDHVFHVISIAYEDSELKILVHCGDSGEIILFFTAGNAEIVFTKDTATEQHLTGNWGIAENEWGEFYGDCSYWFQFNDDHTVTGNVNGYFEGMWYPVEIETEDATGVLIEYSRDGETEYLQGTYRSDTNRFILFSANGDFVFRQVNDIELSVIRNSTNLLIGSWTSLYTQKENKEYTSNYTIDFLEDGTFTADFAGQTHKGTWSLDCYYFSEEDADEEIPYLPSYTYDLYFNGQKRSVSCQLDARSDQITLHIYATYPNANGRSIQFMMLDEEEFTAWQSGSMLPIGTWTNEGIHMEAEDAAAANISYLSFRDDGTYAGSLGEEFSGTWEFLYYYKDTITYTSDSGSGSYEVDRWEYRITTDFGSTHFRIENNGGLRLYVSNEGKSYTFKNYEADLKFPFYHQGTDMNDPNLQLIIGEWFSTDLLRNVKNEPNPTPVQTKANEYYLTFYADGTFSGKLFDEVSGKWRLRYYTEINFDLELLSPNEEIVACIQNSKTSISISIADPENPNIGYDFLFAKE